MKTFGIDISCWQKGIDFDKIKAEGVNFIIIRAAYSTSADKCFEDFYKKAKARGIGVGAYVYSMAKNKAQAIEEANYLIKILSGKQLEYPVYIDVEDKTQRALSKAAVDEIVTAFCTTMEKAGYYAGFYTNSDWYMNRMNGAKLAQRFTHWRAQWSKSEMKGVDLWQFGGETNYIRSTKVAGQTVDQNYCFKDFPTIIKNAKLNGFGTEVVKPAAQPVKVTATKKTTVTYTVKNGDTLSSIARKYGTTYQQIAKDNNIKNVNLIYAGQKLKITK